MGYLTELTLPESNLDQKRNQQDTDAKRNMLQGKIKTVLLEFILLQYIPLIY